MQQWRLLDSGPADAYTNMALDEALLLAQGDSDAEIPTLRFYGWRPRAISLGYAQKATGVVDQKACQQAGIDIVRRTTGGRAVYHNSELTYSLTVKADNKLFSSSIRESYAAISQGLLAGLTILGIKARLTGFREAKRKTAGAQRSGACFLAPSWYEIMADGKKLIGSAQRRIKRVILQQGSIPLQMEDSFFDYWQLPEAEKLHLKTQWRQKTTALQDLTGPLSLDRIKQAFIEGFEQALPVKLAVGNLNAQEERLVKSLRLKYSSHEWNLKE